MKILSCDLRGLDHSWSNFKRNDLHKLSAVDATSFSIMIRTGICIAFTVGHRFAVAGFRLEKSGARSRANSVGAIYTALDRRLTIP